MRTRGVLVKRVSPNYEMSDEEAERIAGLTGKGYIVILNRRDRN